MDKLMLGQSTVYSSEYAPELLQPLCRRQDRQACGYGLSQPLPFFGVDIWNAFEVTWLHPSGVPQVALITLTIPCDSPYMVESKSLKLYLGSLRQKTFAHLTDVEQLLARDLKIVLGASIKVQGHHLSDPKVATKYQSVCYPPGFEQALLLEEIVVQKNHLDPASIRYERSPEFIADLLPCFLRLATPDEEGLYRYYTHVFQSNCPVTNQPDWASLYITLSQEVQPAALLAYLISYRCHNGFHENCIELIFKDLKDYLQPKKLTVYGRFNRRGGIDINPFRSNFDKEIPPNSRLLRQ